MRARPREHAHARSCLCACVCVRGRPSVLAQVALVLSCYLGAFGGKEDAASTGSSGKTMAAGVPKETLKALCSEGMPALPETAPRPGQCMYVRTLCRLRAARACTYVRTHARTYARTHAGTCARSSRDWAARVAGRLRVEDVNKLCIKASVEQEGSKSEKLLRVLTATMKGQLK